MRTPTMIGLAIVLGLAVAMPAAAQDEGGAELQAVAEELDTLFVAIGERATNH